MSSNSSTLDMWMHLALLQAGLVGITAIAFFNLIEKPVSGRGWTMFVRGLLRQAWRMYELSIAFPTYPVLPRTWAGNLNRTSPLGMHMRTVIGVVLAFIGIPSQTLQRMTTTLDANSNGLEQMGPEICKVLIWCWKWPCLGCGSVRFAGMEHLRFQFYRVPPVP